MRTLHLPIAEPCHEDWEAMDVAEQGRFCQKCTKPVHDLSSMTEPEARSLLRARAGGRICVRYEHDDAGKIRFRAPADLARAALVGVALAACAPHESPRTDVRATQSMDVITPTPAPVAVTPIAAPPEPEVRAVKGELAEVPPPEVHVRKGDVAVPNEPCDPPAVAAPEPRPVHARMGKPVLRRDGEF